MKSFIKVMIPVVAILAIGVWIVRDVKQPIKPVPTPSATAVARFPHEAWKYAAKISRPEKLFKLSVDIEGKGLNVPTCIEWMGILKGINQLDGLTKQCMVTGMQGINHDWDKLSVVVKQYSNEEYILLSDDSLDPNRIWRELAKGNPVAVLDVGGPKSRYSGKVKTMAIVVGWDSINDRVAMIDPNWTYNPEAPQEFVEIITTTDFLHRWCAAGNTTFWLVDNRRPQLAATKGCDCGASCECTDCQCGRKPKIEWVTEAVFATLMLQPPQGGNRDQRPLTPTDDSRVTHPPMTQREVFGLENIAKFLQMIYDKLFQPGGMLDKLDVRYQQMMLQIDGGVKTGTVAAVIHIVCNIIMTLSLLVIAIAVVIMVGRTGRNVPLL